MTKVEQTYSKLQEQRDDLTKYLKSKVGAEDWHAVQDAASDIREIDAKIELMRELAGLPV